MAGAEDDVPKDVASSLSANQIVQLLGAQQRLSERTTIALVALHAILSNPDPSIREAWLV